MIIIGQETLREQIRIDVMAHLKASVLKAHGREDGPEMETTAGAATEPNAGAVLRAAMAVTAFGPGGDAPGVVDDDITLALLSQRLMMFQDDEMEMQDRVGGFETAVDDAVDYGLPLEYSKMLRDIVLRTHLDVSCWTLLGDPSARVKSITLRLQPGPRVVLAKPRASPIVNIPGDENCWRGLLSRWVTRPGAAVCVHASVKYTEVLFAGSDKFPT